MLLVKFFRLFHIFSGQKWKRTHLKISLEIDETNKTATAITTEIREIKRIIKVAMTPFF